MIDFEALVAEEGTRELEGESYGVGSSFILVDMAPGRGVRLHRHPYAETFIVQEGTAVFRIGTETLEVVAPKVLVVAGGTPHGFFNSGTGRLRQVDVHDGPAFVTEWLEPE